MRHGIVDLRNEPPHAALQHAVRQPAFLGQPAVRVENHFVGKRLRPAPPAILKAVLAQLDYMLIAIAKTLDRGKPRKAAQYRCGSHPRTPSPAGSLRGAPPSTQTNKPALQTPRSAPMPPATTRSPIDHLPGRKRTPKTARSQPPRPKHEPDTPPPAPSARKPMLRP